MTTTTPATPMTAAIALAHLQYDITQKMAANEAPNLSTIAQFSEVLYQVKSLCEQLPR